MGNYCTLEEVKTELKVEDDEKDGMLSSMITQTKEFIDKFCGRVFEAADGIKYYDGANATLFVDDLLSITSLKLDIDGDGTYEKTLSSSDYILYPLNDFPKKMIKLSPNSAYSNFAAGVKKGVEIDGSWGYSSTVPEPIRRAAIIQVCRWFKRKDSAFSDVVGTAEMGQMIMYKGLDPDIKLLLQGYVKAVFA